MSNTAPAAPLANGGDAAAEINTVTTAPATSAAKPAAKSTGARLSDDEQGATAVEFAIIAMPFMAMLMGIISVCLYFFTMLEMENAVWQVSRDIRVGKYGKGTDGYSVDAGGNAILKEDALRNKLCEKLRGDQTACQTNIRIILQSRATVSHSEVAASLAQPNCKKADGNLRDASAFDTPGAKSFVVLTGCYSWDLGGRLPFFQIGNLTDGSFLVQATFAFVNENYN
jgi:Flp pilus assembly protein TadG